MRQRAIVVTGRTEEPIDQVRSVVNFSRGIHGYQVAQELTSQGVEVTLVVYQGVLRDREYRRIPGAEVIPYKSCGDINRILEGLLTQERPWDFIVMAAAISDYAPIPVEGKISSDQEELIIRMRKNLKILPTLRERAGPETFIVGYKLLVGVSKEELTRVGRAQLAKCKTDLCVANDLLDISEGSRKIQILCPDGMTILVGGRHRTVARTLAKYILLIARQQRVSQRELQP